MVCAIGSSKLNTTTNVGPYYLASNGRGLGVWLPVTAQTPTVSALQLGTDITAIQTSPSQQPYINSAAIRFFIISNPNGINCSDITFTFTNTSTGDLAVTYYPYPQALFEMTAWLSGGNNVLTIDTSNVDSFEAPLMMTVTNGATTLGRLGNLVTSPHVSSTTVITGPNNTGGTQSPFYTWLQGQSNGGASYFQNLALSSASGSPEQYPYALLQSPKDYLTAKCTLTNSGYVPSTCSLNNSLLHWSSPLNTYFDVQLSNFFQNAYANSALPLVVMGDASGTIAEGPWTANSNTANCPAYQTNDGQSLQLTNSTLTMIICNPVGQVVSLSGSAVAYSSNQVQVTQQQYQLAQSYSGWNFGQPETGFVGTITGVTTSGGQYFINLSNVSGSPNFAFPVWAFTNIKTGLGLNIFETSSQMVFANDGAFSSWISQYYSAGDLQTVALSVARNIVAAFSRGVANCNNLTMHNGQAPSFCQSVTPVAGFTGAANASDVYWVNETNWFPAAGVYDLYAAYSHTARLDNNGNIVPGATCPTSSCSNILLVPNNSISAVANSNQGIPMGMGYAFGYDENPVYLSSAPPQVPSKLDPIPTSWGSGLNLTVTIGRTQPGSSAATHDFNGDGYSDIAWRNSNGDVAIWLMNGTQVLSAPDVGNVSTSWSIVGQRQLNNSGYADLIWRNTNGDVAIWLMNGAQILSAPDLANVPTSWTIVGTGPYNTTNGYAELFWRNSNGDVAVWEINGTQILAAPDLGNVPTSWTIVGTGDFNGDGNTDILWRNANGDVAIWLMNGTQVVSAPDVGNVPTSWAIVGTGDFNGDGKTDILWRNANGDVAIWLMNGTQILSAPDVGNVPASWTIAETGDFNGDGYSDILWRNANGDVAIWLMNGTQVVSAPDVGNVPTSWTIQGANTD
jgi:hypothetical protein